MKKLIPLILSLLLILSLAVPVAAVTPTLQPPDLPDVPDISGSVHVELPEDYWETYFRDNPIIIKPISRPFRWRWMDQTKLYLAIHKTTQENKKRGQKPRSLSHASTAFCTTQLMLRSSA